KNSLEHFDFVCFAARHHGGDEVARSVIAEPRSPLPWRAVVGAGNMRDMVLDMVLPEVQFAGLACKRGRQQTAHIAHRLLALTEANEIQEFGWVCQSVLDFPRQVRVAILTH